MQNNLSNFHDQLSMLLNSWCVKYGFCLSFGMFEAIASQSKYQVNQLVSDVFFAEQSSEADKKIFRVILENEFREAFGCFVSCTNRRFDCPRRVRASKPEKTEIVLLEYARVERLIKRSNVYRKGATRFKAKIYDAKLKWRLANIK